MPDYRYYFLDEQGHVARVVELESEHDQAAEIEADRLRGDHGGELWQLQRKIKTHAPIKPNALTGRLK